MVFSVYIVLVTLWDEEKILLATDGTILLSLPFQFISDNWSWGEGVRWEIAPLR